MDAYADASHLSDDWRDALAESLVTGRCSNPVRVSGGHYVRCRSRLKSKCPSCAEITRSDWAAIARSGIFDAPESHYRFYFLTLTAPSFGSVHYIPNPQKHRDSRRCGCGKWHTAEDGALSGVAIDPNSYDYAGSVEFNHSFGLLWANTRRRLRDRWDSLEFFAVREWQDRGVLHLHVILRIQLTEAPAPLILQEAARTTVAVNPVTGSLVHWGLRSQCDPVRQDDDGARTIWYVSKVINYTFKDLGTRYGGTMSTERWDHLRRLTEAARRMRCLGWTQNSVKHPCGGTNCPGRAHQNWGARGQVVSYARSTAVRQGWSFTGLTRRRQREARLAWMEGQADGHRLDEEDAAWARWARIWLAEHMADGRRPSTSRPRGP